MKPPQNNAPPAVANEPNKLYHASSLVRCELSETWASPDNSIAMNGPISFPDGDITPNMAEINNNQKLDWNENVIPVKIDNEEPIMRLMRRPQRSAWLKNYTEKCIAINITINFGILWNLVLTLS